MTYTNNLTSSEVEFVEPGSMLYADDIGWFSYADPSSWDDVFTGNSVGKLVDPLVHTEDVPQGLPLIPK